MSKYKYEMGGIIRDTELDMPYYTDDIVDLLDEKDQKIAELERDLKLACKFIPECPYCYSDENEKPLIDENSYDCNGCIERCEGGNEEKDAMCWVKYFKAKAKKELNNDR